MARFVHNRCDILQYNTITVMGSVERLLSLVKFHGVLLCVTRVCPLVCGFNAWWRVDRVFIMSWAAMDGRPVHVWNKALKATPLCQACSLCMHEP